MRFSIDVEKCTECKRCMIACSLVKTGAVRMRSARIDIRPSWPDVPDIRVCRFDDCTDHPCIEACPVSAIHESDGAVLIDGDACIGCGSCVGACPYNAIRLEGNVAYKCDFCGGDPACVKECVTGALACEEGTS